jgi:transmembrane sensor
MSRAHPRQPMNTQIYEEASDWLVKHRTGELGEADRVAFDSWLRTSPAHVRAYLEMSEIWEDAAALDPATSASVDELVARAQGEGNVVALSPKVADRGAVTDARTAWKVPARVLLAAAVAVVCVGGGVFAWLNRAPVYSTGVGEQRSLTLEDGSTVTLDTRTRIRVRFSARERDIELLEGQALFRVAKNDRQPFVVKSDAAAVRVVGTEFDMYRQRAGVTVTVLEGRVAVTSSSEQRRADDAVLVPAGQQVAVLGSAAVTPSAIADVAAATAWTQRRLIFESTPLSAVVEEFNRYNTRRLVIAAPRLSSFHVSGVFSSTDPTLLVQFLRMQAEIAVSESDHEIDIDER